MEILIIIDSCYDVLQEYQKISGLLIALQEKHAVQQFTSKFLKENDTRIWNYNLKAALLIQAQMIDELMRLREQLRTGTYLEKCVFYHCREKFILPIGF